MDDVKVRLRWIASLCLSVAAACIGSGTALATCTPALPVSAGSVPCYIIVQPIDVGTTVNGSVVYAPFNTTSQTGNPTTAGQPFSMNPITATMLPNNPTSANPIGFVVDPGTGLFPGQPGYSGTGVDVTRVLLNNVGVDLVWLSMTPYVTPGPNNNPSQNFTTLNIVPTQASNTAVARCSGYISATTLTVINCNTLSDQVPSTLDVYDFLSGAGIQQGTFISALGTGSGGSGTYRVNVSQTAGSAKKPLTITAFPGTLGSPDLLTLAGQIPSTSSPPAPPCSISQMTIPPSPPCGSPAAPLSSDPGTMNLFFVNKLNPPASGGTLYGFSLIGNNGAAIGGNTFFAPTPLQARPDTIAHELLHNLGLQHTNYGAGPYTLQTASNPFPPGGIAPPVLTANPFTGECDPDYPACGANLMTSGNLRTEPTLPCVLAGFKGAPVPSICSNLPSFLNEMADQVTTASMEDGRQTPPPTTPELPISQQTALLAGRSGLLDCITQTCSPIQLGGLINPIPYETTKVQLRTDGSAPDRVIFDLSGPVDGKPGETLVAWILSLPEEDAFAGPGGFDVISQSRNDLVEGVNYYPMAVNNPLMRNIAYDRGADDNRNASLSPCAATMTVCLTLKFQAPGLGAYDSLSFSARIFKAGAPIARNDLCKAKITYVFSDGYTTTSSFSRCPPDPLPLIASSWRPDPYVAPNVVRSNVLLAATAIDRPCTPDSGGCPDPTQNPPADSDPTQEGGQLGQSCNNGVNIGSTNVSGTIPGPNVTVSAGQLCNYTNCEFLGSLTINGGNVFLGSCQVDGNLTMTSGTLNLAASTQIMGNVEISGGSAVSLLPNGFRIGPRAKINGGLTIKNLPANEPGLICGTAVSGGVTVNGNQSAIAIGQPAGQQNCSGNTIAGGLTCKGNTGTITGGGNTVTGRADGQCAGLAH